MAIAKTVSESLFATAISIAAVVGMIVTVILFLSTSVESVEGAPATAAFGAGTFQIVAANSDGPVVWRLNTSTGELMICSTECRRVGFD